MNRMTLCLGMLVAGAIFWADRHVAWRSASEQARQVGMDRIRSQAALAAVRTEVAARQAELEALIARTAVNRKQLAGMVLGDSSPASPGPLIIGESAWPNNRPYFLLRKDRLPQIQFNVLDDRGDISAVTASLFAMSPAEHLATLTAWRDHRRQIEELQVTRAERVDSETTEADTGHHSITYRIPALAHEAASATGEFRSGLEAILGAQRAATLAELLMDVNLVSDLNQAREVSYVVETAAGAPVKRQLVVRTATGAMFAPIPDDPFPKDEDHPLWRYRHFFGVEELKPAN